ncbi:hypothetical protein AIB06_005016 [Salmonella enterica subsp. enterica serovar Elokate]|nr:hypothetical protein [Salmonella enterica subsp. enterica]EEE9143419.1 hypothetical protein [Salmonella enterica subsp. enterica serovar Plymouth]EEG8800438.1 hypothetical protein [Salmonella enterica subsp. enterica serovar Durham]EGT9726513.1 hypothetical protein [Salmonella enterica]EGZ3878276.1 hypothetical protein [Salmonella enterica subsp. enterica serovar Elokate]EHW1158160.1 hypothetical protein [Salmonella enterica subsp. enterica serovar Takoradi]
MNHLSKTKQSQRAFTLIEVAFVIILFVLGILGGVYYLHQEREFTTANLIAKQLSYIAGSVAQFSWPVTEESKKIQTYDITALEKMGVISSDIKYMLHYQVRLFWQDKHTYTELVFIKPAPVFDIEQLISISGLVGADGGYMNRQGEIVMSSSHIYNNIKPVSGQDLDIPVNTPVILKLVRDVDKMPPRIINVKESLFEWGALRETHELDDDGDNPAVAWYPAFTDDRVIISWATFPNHSSDQGEYLVVIKDAKSKRILSQSVNAGKNYVFIPRMTWVGKQIELSLFIQQGINSRQITRVYDIKQPQFRGNIDIQTAAKVYVPDRDYRLSPLVTQTQPWFALNSGTPMAVCLTRLSFKTHKGKWDDYHRLLVPFAYDIEFDYGITTDMRAKHPQYRWYNKSVTTGVITALPYLLPEMNSPDYGTMGGERCIPYSESSNSQVQIVTSPIIFISEMLNKGISEIMSASGQGGTWIISWN